MERKYKHIMIDIETLGTDSNSVITSISAIKFDLNTGERGDIFEVGLDILPQLLNGAVIDKETLEWWTNQEMDAKDKLLSMDRVATVIALQSLNEYFRGNYQLWGNGSTFDNVIVSNLMERMGIKINIDFWNHRDVRTLVSLAGINTRDFEFIGIKHNGIDDCKHQIKYCVEANSIIQGRGNNEK